MADKSLDKICQYLEDKGFDSAVVCSFREQQLDGNAIAFGIASSPGPDWLRDVISTLGTRLKAHQALRSLFEDEVACDADDDFSPLSSPEFRKNSKRVSSPTASTVTVDSDSTSKRPLPMRDDSAFVPSLKRTKTNMQMMRLPDPFPIPKFRSATEVNLACKILIDTDRKYMVQTLATVLMTHIPKPSLQHCSEVAKSLVTAHPFLKDEEGDGEHSWKWFVYYRCQNINRKPVDHTSSSSKETGSRAAHYMQSPPPNADDDISYKRNIDHLNTERKKTKPRAAVLKELMCRTFPSRWEEYTNGTDLPLSAYLERFPLLKKAAYVSQDFATLTKDELVRDKFEENVLQWCQAIARYCRETQLKNSSLQAETSDFTEDIGPDRCAMMALRCLSILYTPAYKRKRLGDDIPYILKIVPRGTPPDESPEINNNQPHIVLIQDDDEDDIKQFFVAVEQHLMLESPSIVSAIFFCIAAHYVFNLSYHSKTSDVWLFIQERIMKIPSKTRRTANPSSTAHGSGISRMYEEMNK